ncbi:FkbM family methyltransferase [Salinibacter ruber]
MGAALSEGTVYSFEMDEDNVKRLRSNVELNNQTESVCIEQLALTDSVGQVRYSKHPGEQSVTYGLSGRGDRGNMQVEVSSTTVDAYCRNRVETVDLLKVDVEGGELKVLRGALETLHQFHPDLLVEVHPARLGEGGESAQEVLRLLVESGYTVQSFWTSGNIRKR